MLCNLNETHYLNEQEGIISADYSELQLILPQSYPKTVFDFSLCSNPSGSLINSNILSAGSMSSSFTAEDTNFEKEKIQEYFYILSM